MASARARQTQICALLFQGVPITSYNKDNKECYLKAHPKWKAYFEPESRTDLKATALMIRSINTLNSRGQSILYAAYRFLPQSDDFAASILLSVPGIDLRIKNRLHENGEIDMAL